MRLQQRLSKAESCDFCLWMCRIPNTSSYGFGWMNICAHRQALEGDHGMRKIIVFVNVIIIAAVLVFVVLYSRFESRRSYRSRIDQFENTTVTLEQVTENYLEGEQMVCDVWAQYITNKAMTMEEAADYIRSSHVLTNTSAHLIYLDTLAGLSTRPKQGTSDEYDVSYKRVSLFENADWIDEIGESINISRAYTNPMNGEQSLAFCNRVTLYDTAGEGTRDAVLLRIVPISEL